MSICFIAAGELLGEIPIETFYAIPGFDAILEEKTGKYIDLYGKTVLYKSDIEWILLGIENVSRNNKRISLDVNISKLKQILSSINASTVIHVHGE